MKEDNTSKGETEETSTEEVSADASVTGEDDVASTEGKENASQDSPSGLTLEELNQKLGRNFKTKEDALASLKETFNFVGKAGQKQKTSFPATDATIKQEVESLKKQVRDTEFYSEHPEYKPYRNIISKMGESPDDVVGMQEFKDFYSALKEKKESEGSKSIVHSNARIQESDKDKQAAFEQAQKTGDWMPYLTKYKGLEIPKV